MKKSHFGTLALIVMALSFSFPLPQPVQAQKHRVKAKALLEVDKVRQGSSFMIAVVAEIQKGFHIQSYQPPEGFIATQISAQLPQGITAEKPWYPPITRTLEIAGTSLPVYEGTQTLAVPMRAAKDAPLGKQRIKLSLRYQACDDKSCFRPMTLELDVPIEVVSADTSVKQINESVFADLRKQMGDGGKTSPVPAGGSLLDKLTEWQNRASGWVSGQLQSGRYGIVLIPIFLLGLVMNLTPCVFPMIPVVAGFFSRQSEGRAAGRLMMGAAFVVGLALMYSTLGLLAGLGGAAFGSLLQNRWVLMGMATVLVALALSMFGVYELKAPGFATNQFQASVGMVQSGTKIAGSFLMGLLLGVVAAPCVGPMTLGLVTFIAKSKNAVLGFLLFFILSVGLGFPYLLFAVYSGAIQKLPRSGEWMVWVDRLFGVILLGFALYLLKSVLPIQLYRILFPLFIAEACLYLGWIAKEGDGLPKFMRFKRIFGTLGHALGLLLLIAPLLSGQTLQQKHPFPPYSDALLGQAKKEGKPVVIDFWAMWCPSCIELEHKTFSDPQVQQELKRFVTMNVDFTNTNSPTFKELSKKFHIMDGRPNSSPGLPVVVFIDSRGRERKDLRLGYFEGPQEFLQRLRQVR